MWERFQNLPGFDSPKGYFRTGYKVKAHLDREANVDVTEINCCVNGCRSFHGAYANDIECLCTEPRFKPDGVTPQCTWSYVRLANRLKSLWANPSLSQEMRHRVDRAVNEDLLQDVFDGEVYKGLLEKNVSWKGRPINPPARYFDSNTDVALGFASDGIQLADNGSESCWPLVMTIYNLPPELRTKQEFQVCCDLVPGRTPDKVATSVDFSSFLGPLLEELRELATTGVDAVLSDGEAYTLRAHLLTISGDMPAITKFMKFKSTNKRFSAALGPVHIENRPLIIRAPPIFA